MKRYKLVGGVLLLVGAVLPMACVAHGERFPAGDDRGPLRWWPDMETHNVSNEAPPARAVLGAAPQSTQLFLDFPGTGHGETATPGEPTRSGYIEGGFSLAASDATWHFAGAHGTDQSLNQLGVSMGRIRLDGFGGSGEGPGTVRSRFDYVDPYHFHGGSPARYSFHGMSVQTAFSGSVMRAATANIEARGLERRQVHSLEFSRGNQGIAAMQIERGGEEIGRVYSLFSGTPKFRIGFDYLGQTNGARHQALTVNGRYRGVTFGASIVNASNPLYSRKNETRLQVGLRFSTRKLYRGFGVATAESTPDQEPAPNTQNYVIGGGLLAVGLGLSSGSSSGDESPRYAGQDLAAFNILNRINPRSVEENREYGGYVYRNPDGSYGNTPPVRGQVASVSLPAPVAVVPGSSTASATYHTHGGPDPRYDNENFSAADLAADEFLGLDGYLGTPAGRFRYHEVSTGAIVTLGTIAN